MKDIYFYSDPVLVADFHLKSHNGTEQDYSCGVEIVLYENATDTVIFTSDFGDTETYISVAPGEAADTILQVVTPRQNDYLRGLHTNDIEQPLFYYKSFAINTEGSILDVGRIGYNLQSHHKAYPGGE